MEASGRDAGYRRPSSQPSPMITNPICPLGEDSMRTLAVVILVFLPVIVLAESFDETRRFELSAEGIQTLKIQCGSGFLTVIGVRGMDRIRASAQIIVRGIQENEFQNYLEKHLRVALEKRGSDAILQADFKKPFLTKIEAKINLTIKLPATLPVNIDDGSGAIIITDLTGGLNLKDNSGSIDIVNMAGKIKVADGSGSIEIRDVRGDVEIQDGSGLIHVKVISGNVNITDGSGEITVQDVSGSVTVTDGSGGISIQDVTQDVFINEAGSGELNIDGVKGKVTMRE